MTRPGRFRRYLAEYVLPQRAALAVLGANVLGRAALGLWWPYATRAMVDRVLVPALGLPSPSGPGAPPGPFPFARFALLLGVGALVLALNFRLQWAFSALLNRLMALVTQQTRTRLADKLLRQSQDYYDAAHAGRLLTVALQDPANLTQQLTASIVGALANAAVVLGGYAILLGMSLPLTLAISAVFPLMVLTYLALERPLARQSEANRESWGILMGMVSEKVSAVRVVRSYATEDAESARFRHRAHFHAGLNVSVTRLRALYGSLNGLWIHVGYLLVFAVGGRLYLEGRTTLGTLVAFHGYFTALYPAVLQICSLPQLIGEASGSLTKVYELADREPTVRSAPGAPRLTLPVASVRFEGVWFRYGEGLPWAVRGVDLEFRAGERLGIVGPSGSGKSTLMALLLRFYDCGRGRVTVNGRDVRDWDLGSLREAFALAPQEPLLFSGTLRENLAFRRGGAGEGELAAALRLADLDAFVGGLPLGLDTRLGERGLSLSGGQRQRLALARAWVARPEVLVLDNCTSALDAATEATVLRRLEAALAGRAAVVVSHRASAVAGCTRLAVLDGGRVAETGTPAELAAVPGYYRAILDAQA